jgi:chorismate mutase/prephenate dehydratase
MQDLLMQRAEVVEKVGALKGRVALRAGREADIIRRLLARHQGPLPPRAIVRIWRELLAGTTAMQSNFTITVCDPDPACGYTQLAREHFGALTPLRVHRTPSQAMAEISSGQVSVAVLPMPAEDESPSTAWWTALLHRDAPRIHIIGRLPFWAPRTEGAPRVQALLASSIQPDPSSADRTLLGLELSAETSRARLAGALVTAGLPPGDVLLRRAPGGGEAHALVDVEGFITEDDPRLAALGSVLQPPVVLGAYAVPISDEIP